MESRDRRPRYGRLVSQIDTRINFHPESVPRAEQLGVVIPCYRPTFAFDGYINRRHHFLAQAQNPNTGLTLLTAPGPLDHAEGRPINGWLRVEDALKLYELAYYCSGDILELGSYEGLSTCILAEAMRDSGRDGSLFTVDLSYRQQLVDNARICGLDRRINIITADAPAAIKSLSPKRFEFIFVDHSYTYDDVKSVCLLLREITVSSGFVLFHDYNDARNGKEPHYGVYQAVIDHLPKQFRLCGVYGCTGLYRATKLCVASRRRGEMGSCFGEITT